MKQRVWSLILALAMVLSLFPAPVWAEGETGATAKETVRYMYYTYSGSQSSDYAASCAMLSSAAGDVVLTEQWYAVKGDVTINGTVTVTDTHQVNLILCDDATLTIQGGLKLWGSSTDAPAPQLTVYGQTGETGKMLVTNSKGDYALYTGDNATAYIRLLGGTLTATGSSAAFSGVACWNEKDYTPNDPVKCVGDPENGITVTISKCAEHSYTYHHEGRKHEYYCTQCGYTTFWNETDTSRWNNCVFAWKEVNAETHQQTCVCGNVTGAAEAHTLGSDGYCTKCGYGGGRCDHGRRYIQNSPRRAERSEGRRHRQAAGRPCDELV